MKIVAIIPARKGSKRLPGKNTKLLNGLPLIEHTIKSALMVKEIDQIVVTSDCEEVLSIAEKYPVTCIKRPEFLARDGTKTARVVEHTLYTLNKEFDTILLLQPTSPLRSAYNINEAIAFYKAGKLNCLVSVNNLDISSEIFKPNGAIYLIDKDVFYQKGGFYSDSPYFYKMSNESSIDIDTIGDFEKVQAQIKEWTGDIGAK
jgi:CMP-N-acetylneuraminic acid synthetase